MPTTAECRYFISEAKRQILRAGLPVLLLAFWMFAIGSFMVMTGEPVWSSKSGTFSTEAVGFIFGVAGIVGMGLAGTWLLSRKKIIDDCRALLIHGADGVPEQQKESQNAPCNSGMI